MLTELPTGGFHATVNEANKAKTAVITIASNLQRHPSVLQSALHEVWLDGVSLTLGFVRFTLVSLTVWSQNLLWGF